MSVLLTLFGSIDCLILAVAAALSRNINIKILYCEQKNIITAELYARRLGLLWYFLEI